MPVHCAIQKLTLFAHWALTQAIHLRQFITIGIGSQYAPAAKWVLLDVNKEFYEAK
jgi:hypothetical protein